MAYKHCHGFPSEIFAELGRPRRRLFHVAAGVSPWPPEESTPSRARLPGLQFLCVNLCFVATLTIFIHEKHRRHTDRGGHPEPAGPVLFLAAGADGERRLRVQPSVDPGPFQTTRS